MRSAYLTRAGFIDYAREALEGLVPETRRPLMTKAGVPVTLRRGFRSPKSVRMVRFYR